MRINNIIYLHCWPSVRSRQPFCVFLWTKTTSRSVKNAKKEQGKNPPILTKEHWSVEDLLICMAKRIFLLVGHMQKIVSIHNRPILSIPFTLPACKSSHSTIIINIILCTDCIIIYIYIYIYIYFKHNFTFIDKTYNYYSCKI